MDKQHAGWDISIAFLEGFLIGWFAFRWYHLPVRMGAGWSWGPRSQEAVFGIGFVVPGYAKEHFGEHVGEMFYHSSTIKLTPLLILMKRVVSKL